MDSCSVLVPLVGDQTVTFCSLSQWGFHRTNGARPGASKVMVVVTDGESHDSAFRDTVIADCDKQGITRFGIAVSDDALSVNCDKSVF